MLGDFEEGHVRLFGRPRSRRSKKKNNRPPIVYSVRLQYLQLHEKYKAITLLSRQL